MRVYGFQRSGNHLLAWMLKENFLPDRDLSGPLHNYGHYTDRLQFRRELAYKHLFLQPHDPPPENVVLGPSLYVYRDGRSVIRSLWLSPGYRHTKWKDDQFSEFLRAPLEWRYSNISHCPQTITLPEHWSEMLDMWWLEQSVMLVRYEELVLEPERVLKDIAARFGLDMPEQIKIPEGSVGLSPSGGGLTNWKDLFLAEDLEYFHSVVPRTHWGLYGERGDL